MQKAFLAILLCLGVTVSVTQGRAVTAEQELIMRNSILELILNTRDSDQNLLLIPGLIRFCFHDCVHICDGCIDTRRKVQGGNNGLEITWKIVRGLYQRNFEGLVSRADFFALACVVASDFAGQRGEQEGTCTNPVVNGLPMQPNQCWPNIKMVWGRRTCAVAQLVEPPRNIPDANQDPYEWFEENMQMTPRETVCIMGSHSVGRLRQNETGFEGPYATHFDVLSNEYYKRMVDGTDFRQEKTFPVVDNESQIRHQWVEPKNNLTRVNSDMFLLYDLGELNNAGRTTCFAPPRRESAWNKHCPLRKHAPLVHEMANDNVGFIKCFGEAMFKMMHTGYEPGELVETGVEIPIPPKSTRPPRATTRSPQPATPPSRRTRNRLRGAGRRRNRAGNNRQGRRRRQRRPQQQAAPQGSLNRLSQLIQ